MARRASGAPGARGRHTAGVPLVSVVIPTYQRKALVVEAIDSALAQTRDDLEVVVVDDGSTDGTVAALRTRYAAEPRVRVLAQANGGTASARNAGIDAAAGTYVALLDSDDLFLPDHLDALVAPLEADASVDLAIGNAVYEGRWGHGRTSVFHRSRYRPPVDLADMCEGLWVLPSATVWRASRLKALRFDPSLRWAEDTEILFRFYAAGGKAVAVDRVVTRYRHHDGAGGAENKQSRADLIQRARLALQAQYADRAPDPRGHRLRLHRRWIRQHRKTGDLAAAWPHVVAWAKAAPWSPRPWFEWWKTRWRARRRARRAP